MKMDKLIKRNHYEEITDRLKQLILNGDLRIGDQLPSTKDMSEQFGVSRLTTREALSALKAMGLIEIRQGGRCKVIANQIVTAGIPGLQALQMNRTTLLDLLEVRQSLEVSNASMAARKRTDEDIAALEGVISEMALAIGDDLEGERTDLLFHLMLVKATHNPIMLQLFETIVQQMEEAIREVRRVELYANRPVARKLYREHASICKAVREGNVNAAANSMRRHLLHVESILLKYL